MLLIGIYVAASIAAFAAYGLDKRAAVAGTRRTPEATLLLLGLIGGWPGAIVGQRHFRHKTQKVSFRIWFWITVAINIAVLIWIVRLR